MKIHELSRFSMRLGCVYKRFLNAIFSLFKMLSYTKEYLTLWKPKMTFRKRYYIKPKSTKFHEKGQSNNHLGFIYKRFVNAIFVFQNVKKYHGLLDFLGTENDVQKVLLYKVQIDEISWKSKSTQLLGFIKQCFLNAIFDFQNVNKYKGLLDFLETENDVQKVLLYKCQIDGNS